MSALVAFLSVALALTIAGPAAAEPGAGPRPEPLVPAGSADRPPAEKPVIIGGTLAKPGAYPWMATPTDSARSAGGCGASLIQTRVVLTAAHCVTKPDGQVRMWVSLGNVNKKKHRFYRVVRYYMSPEYRRGGEYADWAILVLARRIGNIPSLPLANNPRMNAGTLRAIGWGSTDPGASKYPDRLRQVDLPSISYRTCGAAWPGKDVRRFVCAGIRKNRNICLGDSGSPVVKRWRGQWYQVGIPAWTWTPCAAKGSPSLLTKITEFGGQIIDASARYAPDSAAVYGPIYARWRKMKGPKSWIGWPAKNPYIGLRGGGYAQEFDNGSIYHSRATGAHFVRGLIRDKWGTLNWEKGAFGYPTTDERCTKKGCGQRFQYDKGAIYFHKAAFGTNAVRGKISQKFHRGGGTKRYGYPKADRFCGLKQGGCGQHFGRASIYTTPKTGTHPVSGAIYRFWAKQDWEKGRLGYPRKDPKKCRLGKRTGTVQAFQGGRVFAAKGTVRRVKPKARCR